MTTVVRTFLHVPSRDCHCLFYLRSSRELVPRDRPLAPFAATDDTILPAAIRRSFLLQFCPQPVSVLPLPVIR